MKAHYSKGLKSKEPRMSNETRSVNAFCWLAPAVRFSHFAILPTGVFWRASVFSWRTSSLVHSRRLTFFAIYLPAPMFGAGLLSHQHLAGQRFPLVQGKSSC